tara:strand:- start:28138 stop:29043 length:906 start_codon:yes stop_codon:yes gene_type:complete
MPTTFNPLSGTFPPRFRGLPIQTREDAELVLASYRVELHPSPDDVALLDTINFDAVEWVDSKGNLKAIPDRVRNCFGLARIVHSRHPWRCPSCPQQSECKMVVRVRLLNGLSEAKKFADADEYGPSTAIFGAADIIFGWDTQHLALKAERTARLLSERRARSRLKEAAARAAPKAARAAMIEEMQADTIETIAALIPSLKADFENLEIGEILATAAKELRLDPATRSTFSEKQLEALGHYWVAEQVIDLGWDDVLPRGKRNALVSLYHQLCGIDRSESASGSDADRKRKALQMIREAGYDI